MNLTPEERAVGRDNYYEAVGETRRDFLRKVVGAGAVSGVGLGAMYFGYGSQTDPNYKLGDPVRVGIIGTGDEGGVLIGALNPNYVQVVAIADIRPYNIHRAFHGDATALDARPGLKTIYGWQTEDAARKAVKVYDKDYKDLLADDDVEAVIIALPLFLHHPVALEAMAAGKHVLTEKLMAHNIAQCKEMARAAEHTGKYLAVGHQRHYSVLYDNAVKMLGWGMLGELQFIRAQWHRSNLPGADGWKPPLPGGEIGADGQRIKEIEDQLNSYAKKLAELNAEAEAGKYVDPDELTDIRLRYEQWKAWDADKEIADLAEKYGYQSKSLGGKRNRSAYEELCRWRLWDRTGGGLMAELGSHQLDAASIFVSALHGEGKHIHPLSVHGIGGRQFFPYDRDAEDHVYCMFQFPAPGYDIPQREEDMKQKDYAALVERRIGYYDPITGYPEGGIDDYDPQSNDHNKKITVTYSSIMGNSYGSYGEVVMGSKGTLILHREQEALLQKAGVSTDTRVKVKADKGKVTMDSYETGGPGPAAALGKAAEGPISRGYTEEIEHWAWCIRNPSSENQPKCTAPVALGDAIMALVAKQAIANSGSDKPEVRAKSYIEFAEEWFDPNSDATPDAEGIEKPRSAEAALGTPYRPETLAKQA